MDFIPFEILYATIFSIISFFILLVYFDKMTGGLALLSIIAGVIIAILFNPYMILVITPIGYAAFYGYSINLYVISCLYYSIAIFIMLVVFIYNFKRSGGKIRWA